MPLERVSWAYVSIDDDREAARAAVREGIAVALWGSREILASLGGKGAPTALKLDGSASELHAHAKSDRLANGVPASGHPGNAGNDVDLDAPLQSRIEMHERAEEKRIALTEHDDVRFMREALKGVPEQHHPMPEGIVTLRVSPETGTLVSEENPEGVPEVFMVSHLPQNTDSDSTTQGPQGPASSEPIF